MTGWRKCLGICIISRMVASRWKIERSKCGLTRTTGDQKSSGRLGSSMLEVKR